MNDLIEGQDRQLSTMLEEILINGDPDQPGSAGGGPPGQEPLQRTESNSDESSALLEQDDERSSPVMRKRKPIRGSSSFPNSAASTPGSHSSPSGATSSDFGARTPTPFGIEHKLGPDAGKWISLLHFALANTALFGLDFLVGAIGPSK